jgi:pimeloyl-ACP methyl ester carboxylesterase
LVSRLAEARFGDFWAFQYGCGRQTLHELAKAFAHSLLTLGGQPVHLVGHSLGGLVIRYAVQHFDVAGLSVALIATPNRGSRLAYLGVGALAGQLRPGSAVLRGLAHRQPARVLPWTAYYSPTDVVVPPSSAVLDGRGQDVVNVGIDGRGHLSILRSKTLADDLAARMHDAVAQRATVQRAA